MEWISMSLREIAAEYEAGRISAEEALELAGCVSLVAMYQLLDEESAHTNQSEQPLARSA